MFLSAQPRMTRTEQVALVEDTAKVSTMVRQVAEFLAKIMTVRHADSQRSFVRVLQNEIHHFPTRERLQNVKRVNSLYRFVIHFEDLATRIHAKALRDRGGNTDISMFCEEHPFYYDDKVVEVGVRTSCLTVGGMYFRLLKEVAQHAKEWLVDLDRVLCIAAGIDRSEAVTRELETTFRRLATAIGKRLALESKHSVLNDMLSSRALDAMIGEEMRRTRPAAESELQMELHAVELLESLVRAPASDAARLTIRDDAKVLLHVVTSPPCELVDAPHFSSLDLGELTRCFTDELEVDVKVALLELWVERHSESALECLAYARGKMERSVDCDARTFASSVRELPPRTKSQTEIPGMVFLCSTRWYVTRVRSRPLGAQGAPKRDGLDEQGLRAVRLIRCLWELAALGVFPAGHISSRMVEGISMESILVGRMAAALINKERRIKNHGLTLGLMIACMHDMEGPYKTEVREAACSLSRFSCAELETVFTTHGSILQLVCRKLSEETRERLTVHVPEEYVSFATDALAILLPLVERRRTCAGITPTMRTNALVDMMCTVEKARSWSPLNGTLRLELGDFKRGHPSLRAALDKLHDANVLVRRQGTATSKRKILCAPRPRPAPCVGPEQLRLVRAGTNSTRWPCARCTTSG